MAKWVIAPPVVSSVSAPDFILVCISKKNYKIRLFFTIDGFPDEDEDDDLFFSGDLDRARSTSSSLESDE